MKRGFIKLYRRIRDNPLYKEKRRFSKSEAWIDLLLFAHHKDGEIIVGLQTIPLKGGDILTSQLGLSKRWNWGIASVKRFLEKLSRENQISFRTESKYTIISISNWKIYQGRAETKREKERKPSGKVRISKAERKKALKRKTILAGKSKKAENKLSKNGKQTETKTETVKKYKNEKEISSKEDKRNPDIDSLISFLKEENNLISLDGSIKTNRQYAFLCLKKFGLEETKKIIEAGSAHDFHSKNMTSMKYVYYNAEKIKRSEPEEEAPYYFKKFNLD